MVNLKPEKDLERVNSFKSPSFKSGSGYKDVSITKYSDGVEYFIDEFLNGDVIKTSNSKFYKGDFLLGVEKGFVKVRIDDTYEVNEIGDFTQIIFRFFINEAVVNKRVNIQEIKPVYFQSVIDETSLTLRLINRMTDIDIGRLKRIMKDSGTEDKSEIHKIRRALLTRIEDIDPSLRYNLGVNREDVNQVDEWYYNIRYQDEELSLGERGIRDYLDTGVWWYKLISHNKKKENLVMTENEFRYYG